VIAADWQHTKFAANLLEYLIKGPDSRID
jgi:hypothetical protein